MCHTKIVATIGPATQEPAALERLIRAGVDVVRLNFSHGEHAQHLSVIKAVREIRARLGRPVALLQDLSGPKIRTGAVRDGEIRLQPGARLVVTTAETLGTPERLSTTYRALPGDVRAGDRILLDDGNLELRVLGSSDHDVDCEVVYGGPLRSHKGMNLPGVALSTPALTEKDRADLAFGVAHEVDFVALSFVRRAADVVECQELVRSLGSSAHVIAKIEKREAVDDLPSILEVTDGLMVARGDLGVELSTEEVPTLQKRIIQMANGAGRVVITATQMLESMIEHPRPTRAEASDVANAIHDGTDAVMLSAETATGRFPIETVETMVRIVQYTERYYLAPPPPRVTGGNHTATARSLARVASSVAEELDCRRIVAFTETGGTARLLSCYRPRRPIAALTFDERTYQRLALWWGVTPVHARLSPTTEEMCAQGEEVLKRQGMAEKGDLLLMLAGSSPTTGATNMLRVHKVS
jgi:pyruvate kinase